MPATSRGTSGGAIAIAFTAFASLTLAARLYTRYFLVKNAGLEEWAIIFAWVSVNIADRSINSPCVCCSSGHIYASEMQAANGSQAFALTHTALVGVRRYHLYPCLQGSDL